MTCLDGSFQALDLGETQASPLPVTDINYHTVKVARSITNLQRPSVNHIKIEAKVGKLPIDKVLQTGLNRQTEKRNKPRVLSVATKRLDDDTVARPRVKASQRPSVPRHERLALNPSAQSHSGIIFKRATLPWLNGKPPSTTSSIRQSAHHNHIPGAFDSDGSGSLFAASSGPPTPVTDGNVNQATPKREEPREPVTESNDRSPPVADDQQSSGYESPLTGRKSNARQVPVSVFTDVEPASEQRSSTTDGTESPNLLPVPVTAKRLSITTAAEQDHNYEFVHTTYVIDRQQQKSPVPQSARPRPSERYRASQRRHSSFMDRQGKEREGPFSAPPPPKIRVRRATSPELPRPLDPTYNTCAKKANAESLNKAIAGMEGLVEEAIKIANEAVDRNQAEIASDMLDQASNMVRKTSNVRDHQHLTLMEPLPVSESSDSCSTVSSSAVSGMSNDEEAALGSYMAQGGLTKGQTIPLKRFTTPLEARGSRYAQPATEGGHHNSVAVDWAYGAKGNDLSEHLDPTAARPRVSFSGCNSDAPPPHAQIRQRKQRRDHANDREDIPDHDGFLAPPAVRPRHSSLNFDRSRQGQRADGSSARPESGDGGNFGEQRHRPRSYATSRFNEDPTNSNQLQKLDSSRSGVSLRRRPHWSLRSKNGSGFSLSRYRHKPVARNWRTSRKRISATIACVNTAFVGYIIGIYAGEVPRIQYQLGDEQHVTILGNVVLYLGLALSTFIFWPLPLLHGRRPYTIGALAIALPLQFPQAISIASPRSPDTPLFRVGLLLSRGLSGFALGFANVNFVTTLLDLFGASLQSQKPHQEIVIHNDPRRHGGGMGLWLGIWSWCFIGSLSLGFVTGAGIIADLNPAWGFYIVVIILAFVLLLNIVTPETRRAMYRQSVAEYRDEQDRPNRILARGEVKLHVSAEAPKYWYEEVWAGMELSCQMLFQFGFAVLAVYWAWIYAQIVLVIVLLGALLSRDYRFYPQYVGCGVLSIGIGALFAVPLAKASFLSRARSRGPRTDSMTIQARVTWTSHLLRRIIFMITLPFVGLGYTLASPGKPVHFLLPCFLAGAIGFLSNLAIAECLGLIMETYDTSDLQPGVNSRHRLQSMASVTKRRRTNYSSFPRVTAGIFVSQALAFCFAAAATGAGGTLTRGLGAQAATGVVAGILLFLTLLLTAVLWRVRDVQVIPKHAFGTRKNSAESFMTKDEYWKPVIIGNPSGKMRRMNVLEMGELSRWTEIRRLNKLVRAETAGVV